MSSNTISPRSLELSIANLGVRLISEDHALLAQLSIIYQAYLGELTHPIQLTIKHTIDPDVLSWERIIPIAQGDKILFTGGAGGNFVDFKARDGYILLSSSNPLDEMEYILRVIYSFLSFESGGLMLHAAGIVHRGYAYLFLGESGSGKTTIARVSAGKVILNDDLVILIPTGREWQVHSTPFWNPSQVRPQPASAELAGLFKLFKDSQVYIEEFSGAQALAEIIACVPLIASHPKLGAQLFKRCETILERTALMRLHFLPDNSFWKPIEAIKNG